MVPSIARRCARALELGLTNPLLVAMAGAYGRISSRLLCRSMRLPTSACVIGVSSAVLGGAGKTPVAAAYASALSAGGARVALVSHGYLATTPCVRIVKPHDQVSLVGDDALAAAWLVGPASVPVFVGPSREQAILTAAKQASVIVVDGLLQTRPRRVARSVLVLDARRPFGSGCCPPAGDLRASVQALLEACDEVVLVCDPMIERGEAMVRALQDSKPVGRAILEPTGLRAWDGTVMSLENASKLRLGLLLLVAHPERVAASLKVRGLGLVCSFFGADHHTPSNGELRTIRKLANDWKLDGWMVTPKCLGHFEGVDTGAQLLAIEIRTRLDPEPRLVLDSVPCVPLDSLQPC